jgi:hypothetical protein
MRTLGICLLALVVAFLVGCGGGSPAAPTAAIAQPAATPATPSASPAATPAASPPAPAPSAQNLAPFTVVALPDTQNYSEFYPATFKAQTQWIVNNRAARNIQFVLGLGDVVNNGSDVKQFQNADAAIRLLDDAGIQYVLPMGNHDYRDAHPENRDATLFNQFFGPQRYAKYGWYKGHHPDTGNENFYTVFNVGGKDYLILALEFSPRDTALDWASSVVSANADKEVIVVTHSFIISNMRVGKCDGNSTRSFNMVASNDGQVVWDKFVRKHKNISMVLNGHYHAWNRRADLGDNGNLVNQILSDYQAWPNGGDGYLRIMTFHPAENRVDVETFSPTQNKFITDADNNFSVKLHTDGKAGTYATGVRGRVHRADCSVPAGATVNGGNAQATVGGNGEFMLPTVPGAQAVVVNTSGMSPATQTAQVNEGYNAQIDYYMVP